MIRVMSNALADNPILFLSAISILGILIAVTIVVEITDALKE